MFITFEGPEGSGKSTQIRFLVDTLRQRGYDVVATREPGGTALGDRIRAMLLESDERVTPEAEAYLMTAARAEHVRRTIRPALELGAIVVCDRFTDSTLAYQGAGRGLPIKELARLQSLAVGDTRPHLTLLLDIDVGRGLARKRGASDVNHMDRESLAFHERVAAWYRDTASYETDRWQVIDGDRPVEEVRDAVWGVVDALLGASAARMTVEGGVG